jgi:hypothetical protein
MKTRTKHIKLRCHICGEIEVEPYFCNDDGAVWVPVKAASTIQRLGKVMKEVEGNTYFQNTGNHIKDDFILKDCSNLCHRDYDDQPEGHYLETVTCWTNSHLI